MTPNTVLIVEDNDALREMFRRRLIHQKFEVTLAVDGEEALLLASKQRFKLILLDLSLPGKNGWNVVSELKSHSHSSSIPVIAITAHAMTGDRERALQSGCDDYVSKPVNFPELFSKMNRFLYP